jgi:Holliday junction resolvase
MVSRNKRAGTAWESKIVAHLREQGWPNAERRALAGGKDKGDVIGVDGVVLEAKAAAAWRVGDWLKELTAEKANAGAETGALVVKRRQQPVGKALVLLELDDYLTLLRRANG